MGRFVFKLPDIGEGTAEAEIAEWRVKIGDRVEEDEPLVDMMTDKATVELTSPVAGTVLSVAGATGDMVPVGAELVVLETEGAAAGKVEEKDAEKPAPEPQVATPEEPVVSPLERMPARSSAAAVIPETAPTGEPRHRILAAPAVRQRAKDLGIDLADVHSSHPGGRIRHADLDAHLAYTQRGAGVPAAAAARPRAKREGVEAVKVIGLRRKIAEKMQEAKRRIPHFAYVEEVDVTELEMLRQHLNATYGSNRPKLTLLPFLVRALVRVLPRYPQINARFDDDAGVVNRHEAVHAGIATQTPNGLVVPVLHHAETHDLWSCASEIARLASAARGGKASPKELSGSTITITSLGSLGGIVTTPVINHPEVAIIGVNKIVDRPVVRQGQIVVRKLMNLSSSFDHRVVDGYDAAEFIQRVKDLLEHPATLFMDD